MLVLAGAVIGAGLHGCLDSDSVDPHMRRSETPCVAPAILPEEFDNFSHWLATQFLPYLGIHDTTILGPHNFGITYEVRYLDSNTTCEGVPPEYYNTPNKHIALTYEFMHTTDGGPYQIGLLFANRWRVLLSPSITNQLAKVFKELRERPGDLEAVRIIVEEDLEAGTYSLKFLMIKQHGNGWIIIMPEYLTCDGTRPILLQIDGKNTLQPSEQAANLSVVKELKIRGKPIVGATGDVYRGNTIFDPLPLMPPEHNIVLGDPFTKSELLETFKQNNVGSADFQGNPNPQFEFCKTN